MITLQHYLILSIVLFVIGAAGVLVRRNMLFILMSLMFMFSAANISLVAFARWNLLPEGVAIALFAIAIEAVMAVVALCVVSR